MGVIRTLEECEDRTWEENWDGDRMCAFYVTQHGKCGDGEYAEVVETYCRKACGKCTATEECANRAWEHALTAEEQCRELRNHGGCDSDNQDLQSHIMTH